MKNELKEMEEIIDWLNMLPQAYDEGLTDIGVGDKHKTWRMVFEKTNRLKELFKKRCEK